MRDEDAEEHGRAEDDELRELTERVLERLERDGPRALEEACAARPDLAARLRKRIASLGELGLVSAPGRPPERVGDFRLEDRIGTGGMGVVYRAVQESLDREVALKLIRPELLFQEGTRRRFARETSIVARLQHPGIVPIYTVGAEADLPWYAMELVAGCTLAEALAAVRATRPAAPDRLAGLDLLRAVCLRSDQPLPDEPGPLFSGTWVETALRVVCQAAEALDHAHGRGVLHRDLKPSNLMVTPDGRVLLVDFGLSHSEDDESLTGTTDRVGSLPYMPPELLRDGPTAVDRRSDVYGLGVVLYELLTLHRPFEQEGVPAILQAILEGRPPRPRAYAPGLSWEAETVCLAAMEPEPRRRYATAGDLARDLTNALERRPIEARRASTLLLARRFVERRPGAAAALVLAVLLPTVAAVLLVRETRNVGAALALAEDERDRADEERERADEERRRAEESLAEGLVQKRQADANRDRALRAIRDMLFEVADAELDHVPGMHELRKDLYERARVLYDEVARETPDDPDVRLLAAEAALERTSLLAREGRVAENEAALLDLLTDLEPLLAAGDHGARRLEAIALQKLAYALRAQYRDDEARETREVALERLRALAEEHPEDGEMVGTWIDTLAKGAMHDLADGFTEAVGERLELAEREARALAARDPVFGPVLLANVLQWRATWFDRMGDQEAALELFAEALLEFEALLADDPRDESARFQTSQAAYNVAVVANRLGRRGEAVEHLELALERIVAVLADFPDLELYRAHADRVLNVHLLLAETERDAGAALVRFERAVAAHEALVALSPGSARLRVEAGTAALQLADLLATRGELERAAAGCARARELIGGAVELSPGDPVALSALAAERVLSSEVLLGSGATLEAARALVEAAELVSSATFDLARIAEQMARVLDAAEGAEPTVRSECRAAAAELERRLDAGGALPGEPWLRSLRERLGSG